MIRADFHNHTGFSTDSETDPEDQIKKAIDLGFTHLCITDHMDRYYPNPDFPFEIEMESYFHTLQTLKEKYRNQIDLLIGIEFGLRTEPEIKAEIRDYYNTLLASYPFDFAIGSTHILDYEDPYFPPYWEGKALSDVLGGYFKTITESASYYSCFDVYGHLDYLVRYTPEAIKDYPYADYKDLIDEALKAILAGGKGIELNTAGLKTLAYPHPKMEVLKRYRELGGEIITIGSDAHAPEFLGYEFGRAEEYLKDCGFRYYTVFKEHKPAFLKLS